MCSTSQQAGREGGREGKREGEREGVQERGRQEGDNMRNEASIPPQPGGAQHMTTALLAPESSSQGVVISNMGTDISM